MSGVTAPLLAAGLTLRAFRPASDYPAAAELICEAHRHDEVDWLPTATSLPLIGLIGFLSLSAAFGLVLLQRTKTGRE